MGQTQGFFPSKAGSHGGRGAPHSVSRGLSSSATEQASCWNPQGSHRVTQTILPLPLSVRVAEQETVAPNSRAFQQK